MSQGLGDMLNDTFSNAGFMPHIHCYLDKASLVWTMVATDTVIGLAYLTISLTLYLLVRKIRLPFSPVFIAFGAFIAACGATHFMEVYTLWVPIYWAAAAAKAVTATASVITAGWLIYLGPRIAQYAARTRDVLNERSASLARTSARLEMALGAARMGLWDWDLETNVLEWSDTLKQLFGYEADSFGNVYEQFASRLHPEDKQDVESKLQLAIKTCVAFDAEYRIVWPSGAVHWIAAQGRVLRDEKGRAVSMVGTAFNIDEQRRSKEFLEQVVTDRSRELSQAQAGLAHAAKLSALGEMAAGVAHEINTPLAAISLQAEQVNRILLKGENTAIQQRALEKLQSIIKTSQRIATIIQGLRTFARDGEGDAMELVPVVTLVQRALSLCQMRFANHNISLSVEADPEHDTRIACRAVQVEQIVLNLLNNAFDAVESLNNRWVRISVRDQQDSVQIAVTDSGAGIPREVAEKMMQPFYTTKGVGRGTGLGLSISNGIATAHGGSLHLDTTAEHTMFILRLPRGNDLFATQGDVP